MNSITVSQSKKGPSAIIRTIRHLLGTPQRRLLRDMRQREAWVHQARTAPTVKAWTDSLER